jgi:hypothetical protein
VSGGYLRLRGSNRKSEQPDDAGRTPPARPPLAIGGTTTQVDHPDLPAPVAAAVQAVLTSLANAPFSAPDAERLRELGLDARATAAAERAGLLFRLRSNVVLAALLLGKIIVPLTCYLQRHLTVNHGRKRPARPAGHTSWPTPH